MVSRALPITQQPWRVPRANTRGMNPALTAHGLQSSIKVIKLQGQAGSLAQGWWRRRGHRLRCVLTTEAFGPARAAPAHPSAAPGVLGR